MQTPWRVRRPGASQDSEGEEDLVSVPAAQVFTRVKGGEHLQFPPLERVDPPCQDIERVRPLLHVFDSEHTLLSG